MSSISIPFLFSVIAIFLLPIVFAALGREQVKLGEQYKYENVPGKLIVRRQTAASKEPQYLFAGQTAWTTDGKDRIGSAELDFVTGTLTIQKFSENDFGTYTFPLEKPNLSAGNGPQGCVLQAVGETSLQLEKE